MYTLTDQGLDLVRSGTGDVPGIGGASRVRRKVRGGEEPQDPVAVEDVGREGGWRLSGEARLILIFLLLFLLLVGGGGRWGSPGGGERVVLGQPDQ